MKFIYICSGKVTLIRVNLLIKYSQIVRPLNMLCNGYTTTKYRLFNA